MKLFKRNKRNQLKVWWYELSSLNTEECKVTTFSGLEGGKIKESYKHLGPTAQDPDPIKRAEKLFSTKAKNKRRDGYLEDREAALTAEVPKSPMHLKRIDIGDVTEDMFPLWVEVKQNGVCGWYDRNKFHMYSRTGEIQDIPHIRKQIDTLIGPFPIVRFVHFENIVPNTKVTTINGWIQKPCEESNRLLGGIFDLIPADGAMIQSERVALRNEVFKATGLECPHLYNVTPAWITSLAMFKECYALAELRGEEGLVGRAGNATYHFDNKTSRGDYAFKCKPLISSEFTVTRLGIDKRTVSVEGQEVKRNLIEFYCNTPAGKEFKVTPAWSQEKRDKWGNNFLFGILKPTDLGPLTVEFREWTSKDLPFHAVGIDFRSDYYKEDVDKAA